jgi:Fe-S-cluster-containing hydrogenase component 2
MNARSLLVLDLEKCTRCDECTKACADAHSGVTRLIREGLRFDKWLVASSCRARLDPYCMVGCPVDSIHRGRSGEMVIEDWCIGCGVCAKQCPYDAIQMHEIGEFGEGAERAKSLMASSQEVVSVTERAAVCDQCSSLSTGPACVYSCPHDAAMRVNAAQFFNVRRTNIVAVEASTIASAAEASRDSEAGGE